MGVPKLSTINTSDPQLNRIQDNVANAFNSLSSPFLGGNYLTSIDLVASTPKPITHGLNRTPVIWALGDITASAIVFRTAWNQASITLEASADCTIAIWVN